MKAQDIIKMVIETLSPQDFVKKSRKELGITQQKLADALNKSVFCISDYETGRAMPSGQVILDIQKMLKKHRRK